MKQPADAAIFHRAGAALEIRPLPVILPPPAHTRVQLVSSGICGTDVHIWEGSLALTGPFIPGHEFLGRVERMGDGDRLDCLGNALNIGDLVAVNVVEPCGDCVLCREGGDASCLHLIETLTYTRSPEEPPHLHGGFAEVTISPTRFLHRLPSSLPADVASVFLCAGPTIVRAIRYHPGTLEGASVVVQGSGPVGLFAVLWAAHHGARVTMIGSSSHPLRPELALLFGAADFLDIRSTDVAARQRTIMESTNGIGADLVIECSGSEHACPEGIGLLRPRGVYLLAGQYSDRGAVPIPVHAITFSALQILGSAQFTAVDRQAYFDFLLTIPELWPAIRQTVTHRFPVRQAEEALRTVHAGDAIKALLEAQA